MSERAIRGTSGAPLCAPGSFEDNPTSRLSNRMTRNPWLTNFSQNSLRHNTSCAPKPMINRTAGSPSSPKSS